jgi:transketolase
MPTSIREAILRDSSRLDARSTKLRLDIVNVLATCGRGHLGSALSVIEIVRVLYDDILKVDSANPTHADRDRFILSKGHGCLGLYVVLADHGFFPREELSKFCKSNGILGGHPEYGRVPGVEASTGALGHGLSIGIGMALAARHDRSSRKVFVLMGDGECDEGSVWEAAMCASKHRLSNLVAMVDRNGQQSFGTTGEVLDLEPFADKWRAFGFHVEEVDGHDVDTLRATFRSIPPDRAQPTVLICHTIKGKGIPFTEGNLDWHHKNSVSADEIRLLRAALEVQHA